MKASSVAGGGAQPPVDRLSLSPSLFSLFFPPRSLSPYAGQPGFTFQHRLFLGMVQWRAWSHADKAWPLISLAGPAPVACVPPCPRYHLAEGAKRGNVTHLHLQGPLFEGIMCNGLDVDSVSFPPVFWSLLALKRCFRHKRALLIRLQNPFPFPNRNSRWLVRTSQPRSGRW